MIRGLSCGRSLRNQLEIYLETRMHEKACSSVLDLRKWSFYEDCLCVFC